MNSTRTKEKPQQQTLSIRISEALRNFLERSQHVISSNRGESVSLSDVARILLESAKDDRLDFRLEVAELQQDPTDSLWAIRKKWEMKQALSRAEWIFLAQYIQLACEGISENPEMPRPHAFGVVLKALMAVRRLRADRGAGLDRYYLGNLGVEDRDVFNERQFDPEARSETAQKRAHQLCEYPPLLQRSRGGRISTVYELADLGVTIVPVKSQTGPVNTAMGRLLWAIQAWYGEMENEERSENVRLGQARARAQGKEIGRPREVANDVEQRIYRLRADGSGYKAISQATGVPRSNVRRVLKGAKTSGKFNSQIPQYQFPQKPFCRVPEVVVFGPHASTRPPLATACRKPASASSPFHWHPSLWPLRSWSCRPSKSPCVHWRDTFRSSAWLRK